MNSILPTHNSPPNRPILITVGIILGLLIVGGAAVLIYFLVIQPNEALGNGEAFLRIGGQMKLRLNGSTDVYLTIDSSGKWTTDAAGTVLTLGSDRNGEVATIGSRNAFSLKTGDGKFLETHREDAVCVYSVRTTEQVDATQFYFQTANADGTFNGSIEQKIAQDGAYILSSSSGCGRGNAITWTGDAFADRNVNPSRWVVEPV